MEKPMIKIHNAETGEIVNREMTTAEFNKYKTEQEVIAAQKAEEETRKIARAELLNRLGITPDEATLLLS